LFCFLATHGPKLVTTGLTVRQYPVVYERPARFRSYNRAYINIFIQRSRCCNHNEYTVGLALK